jgi:hypothetical protein
MTDRERAVERAKWWVRTFDLARESRPDLPVGDQELIAREFLRLAALEAE